MKREIINVALCVQTLKELRPALRDKRPVIPQHYNARPHPARLTSETVSENGWELFPHQPNTKDLGLSDYHLFGALKDHMRGQHYGKTADSRKP